MSLKIAIQPDEVVHRNGERQSFSRRWVELARSEGTAAVQVDAFACDIMSQAASCDAFMWRCSSSSFPRLYAKRLLYVLAGLPRRLEGSPPDEMPADVLSTGCRTALYVWCASVRLRLPGCTLGSSV